MRLLHLTKRDKAIVFIFLIPKHYSTETEAVSLIQVIIIICTRSG
jgi:hypothetical protein